MIKSSSSKPSSLVQFGYEIAFLLLFVFLPTEKSFNGKLNRDLQVFSTQLLTIFFFSGNEGQHFTAITNIFVEERGGKWWGGEGEMTYLPFRTRGEPRRQGFDVAHDRRHTHWSTFYFSQLPGHCNNSLTHRVTDYWGISFCRNAISGHFRSHSKDTSTIAVVVVVAKTTRYQHSAHKRYT